MRERVLSDVCVRRLGEWGWCVRWFHSRNGMALLMCERRWDGLTGLLLTGRMQKWRSNRLQSRKGKGENATTSRERPDACAITHPKGPKKLEAAMLPLPISSPSITSSPNPGIPSACSSLPSNPTSFLGHAISPSHPPSGGSASPIASTSALPQPLQHHTSLAPCNSTA